MSHGYPILLDVSRRRILIVGAGSVAARKTAGLLDAGATDITAVAEQFSEKFPKDNVTRITGSYAPEQLDGAELVFAATDQPEVNTRVVADARERNILVCRSDGDEQLRGDFTTPAKYQDQNVMVTVSAASAALAASIRNALQQRWDPRWTKMAGVMTALRPWLKSQKHLTQEQRAHVFRKLAGEEAMDVLMTGDAEKLREWLKTHFPYLRDEQV